MTPNNSGQPGELTAMPAKVDRLVVTDEAKSRYPGISVLTIRATVGDIDQLARRASAGWQELWQQWANADESELLEIESVRAYRTLCEQLGLNPDRNPPSVQALVNRGLRGRQAGAWPRINPVVDMVNVVAVRTMISLGVFDASRLTGAVRLALTGDGEPFHALGASTPKTLPSGELVLHDDARVLSLFSRRDGVHQAVQPGTREVLLLGCVVPGVNADDAATALVDAANAIAGQSDVAAL